MTPRAVIFDLGGTLLDWPDWDADSPRRWGIGYDVLRAAVPRDDWPEHAAYVEAMRAAELDHWRRVEREHTSGSPVDLVQDGFRRLGRPLRNDEVLSALDGYATAVDGWARVEQDARATLARLRERGYRIGLLSNTWWAAGWHNRDLAMHGLAGYFDAVAYTSDLPHSKPHASVFLHIAGQLHADPGVCVMVGDRMIDDVGGALGVGMRGVWKHTASPFPRPREIVPSATIARLEELPSVLKAWGG